MQAAPPSPLGVANLADDERKDGLYLHKTLWAVSPHTSSDLTITAETAEHAPVRFFNGRRDLRVLRFPQPTRGWTYATTTTLLPGPGCFAFLVRGHDVRRRIVFEARLRR